jgi:hypothetical protein
LSNIGQLNYADLLFAALLRGKQMMKRLVWVAAFCVLVLSGNAARAETETAAIPGARTCFWYNGPFGKDPYINVAYPDAYALYWTAAFNIPEGAQLALEGQYAHARYISFITYNHLGQAIESVADYRIDPLAGSTNPFRAGANRKATKRNYRLAITSNPQALDVGDGLGSAAPTSSINAPPNPDGYQSIIYRIYANDKGRGITGGMPLPDVALTLKDGTVLRGEKACDELDSRRGLRGRPEILNVPAARYHELRKDDAKRPTGWPAKPELEWHVQHSRPDTLSIFTGDHEGKTAHKGGDFYPNPDNRYVRAFVSTKLGETILLRGKAPATPRTFNADAVMGAGDMRYWSLCSNEVMVNTRVTECLLDEQVPLDDKGYYTIVASKENDRPRNARAECGIAWLRLPNDGDGLGDPDISLLLFRHMLADPTFKPAAQNLMDDAEIVPEMGEYLPRSSYMMKNAIETIFPCPINPGQAK